MDFVAPLKKKRERDITAQLKPPVTGVNCTHLEVSGRSTPPASNGGDETGDLGVFFTPDVVILSHTCFFFLLAGNNIQQIYHWTFMTWSCRGKKRKNKNDTAGKHFTIKSWCMDDPQCNLDAES